MIFLKVELILSQIIDTNDYKNKIIYNKTIQVIAFLLFLKVLNIIKVLTVLQSNFPLFNIGLFVAYKIQDIFSYYFLLSY